MRARYPIPDNADTWEMVKQVIDMDLEIRIEHWGGPACTVIDELYSQKGCAQLRGEGAGETYEEALRDACNQAINHLHPADPDCDPQILADLETRTAERRARVHDGESSND